MKNLFEDVENKHVNKVVYSDHPYGPEELKRKFYIVPVKDIRSLKISFSAPDVVDQYRTAVSSTLLKMFAVSLRLTRRVYNSIREMLDCWMTAVNRKDLLII